MRLPDTGNDEMLPIELMSLAVIDLNKTISIGIGLEMTFLPLDVGRNRPRGPCTTSAALTYPSHETITDGLTTLSNRIAPSKFRPHQLAQAQHATHKNP
jgi:hypothetical protein